MPRGRSAHGDGERREEHLHDAIDAGVCVAVDNVAHGVGDEQTGDQDHQRADDDRVRIVDQPEGGGEVGGHRHGEGGGDGAEKGVGLELIHPARDKADDKPHQARPQAVAQGSAKDGAEARRGKKIAEVVDGNGVGAAGGARLLQPLRGNGGVGRFGADAARKRVEPLDRVKIVAVEADALHHHQRLAVVRLKADHDAVGDRKGLAFDAVGREHAAHRLLDAEGLRSGGGQLIADLRGHIRQKIVVHEYHSCRRFVERRALSYCESIPLSRRENTA